MKAIEKKMVAAKAALQEAISAVKDQKQNIEKLELEIEEMTREKKTLEEVRLAEIDKHLRAMEKELQKMEEGNGGLKEKQAAYEGARMKLQTKQVR